MYVYKIVGFNNLWKCIQQTKTASWRKKHKQKQEFVKNYILDDTAKMNENVM